MKRDTVFGTILLLGISAILGLAFKWASDQRYPEQPHKIGTALHCTYPHTCHESKEERE